MLMERAMRKHKKECLSICTGAGLAVLGLEHRGKHIRVNTEQGFITMPSTPSDRRWRYNAKSIAKKMASIT